MNKQKRTFAGQFFQISIFYAVKINQTKIMLTQCNSDGTPDAVEPPLRLTIFGVTNQEFNTADTKLSIENASNIYEFYNGQFFNENGDAKSTADVYAEIEGSI